MIGRGLVALCVGLCVVHVAAPAFSGEGSEFRENLSGDGSEFRENFFRDFEGSRRPSPAAVAQWIADPENPATAPESSSVEQQTTPDDSWIVDPQNPTGPASSEDIEGSGRTPDAAADSPARPSGRPPVIISGTFGSAAAFDIRAHDTTEDVFLWDNQLDLRLRVAPDDRDWRIVMSGRLSWWMTGRAGDGRSAFAPYHDTLEAAVEPELRDLYFFTAMRGWTFRVGQFAVRWGSGDFFRPSDVVNPRDLRRGLGDLQSSPQIPVPMAEAVRSWDAVDLSLLLLPFFRRDRFDVYGSDYAVFQQGGGALAQLPVTDLARGVIDRSIEAELQEHLVSTEEPDALPRNVSFGARITHRVGSGEYSFGYLFDWDRVPDVEINPQLIDIVSSGTLPDLIEGVVNAGSPFESVFALGQLLDSGILDVLTDGTILRSRYHRRHTLAHDGVQYVGPVGLRWDVAFQPSMAVNSTRLDGERAPVLSASVGASHERSDGALVVSGEGFYRGTFSAGEPALFGKHFWGIAVGGTIAPGVLARTDSRWDDLTIQPAVVYFGATLDALFRLEAAFSVLPELDLAAGAQVVYASGRESGSLGAWLDHTDSVYVRLGYRF